MMNISSIESLKTYQFALDLDNSIEGILRYAILDQTNPIYVELMYWR